jgi:Ca2+-binding RTX toxin-like protein
MADSDSSGAGLIQADKAVGFASTLTISNSDQTTLLGTHLADTISGSSANDTLEGFAGNDIIDGGAGGRDIAAFTGDKSDYTIERHLDRSVTVTDTRASSPDGADTLTQISTLQFSDSSVSIDPNAPAIAIGTLDMMTANETSNNVDILLGDGHGGFAAAAGSPVAVGSFPLSVALGDLNGDGVLDMVVANVGSDNVSVMLGDGHSGFTAASGSPVAVGSEPSSVALGDLDGDGHLDIVAANNGSNTISVLLGNGNGGFAAAAGSPLAVGLIPLSVALGDLDGNGNLDIVTADFNSNAVSVLLGNGAGGFTAAPGSPVAVGTGPRSVALGDLNGDGNLDIVTADSNSNTVSVLLGDGAGGFAAAAGSPVAVGLLPSSVALGDLNGDGSLDVVTANAGSNNVSVLLGDGNGGFAPAAGSPVAIGSQPSSVALGDLDGNGHLDIVAANSNSNNVSVLLGDGTGGFTAASPAATAGTGPASVALGYLDTAQTTNEDTPLVFSAARNNAIVISDADGDNQMVTLSAGHGKLTLSGTSGLTFSSGGNGQASMTFSGTLAAINTALTGLTYLSDLNYNGADALAITSSDGLDQTHSTAPITLNAVNDRATAEPDAVATNEATVLTGNLFADNGQGPDNDPEGDPFSVTKINGVAVTQGTPITLASGALLTITNVATGAFTYDPNHKFDYLPDSASGASNLTRDDIFDYTITGGSTARATVTISGLDSNDSVQDTFFFPDILRGGIGNDAYYVEDTADQVIENPGEGRDVVYAYTNYTIPDNVETLVLMSLFSDDPPGGFTGTGNAVSNAIVSVGNHHNMIGLGGNDFYYVHNIGDIVIEDPNEGSDVVYSTIDYTIPNNVESLFMVGRGLTGTGSSNNDMLGSVGGPNTLIGLGGNDAYYVHNAGDVVQESAGGGSDVVYATVSYTISANVETLVMVGSGLTGTGSAGNDMLASSGGPNTLVGLGGNDAYYVNNLGDQVVEAGGGGSDVVYATVNYTIPANVETLVMVGSGLTGTGSAGNDALGSSRGPNTLVGLGGNDAYYVNNAGDHVTEAAGAGSDVVYATVNYTIPANVETLVMVGSGLTGTGSAGNDVLGSSGGHNTLIGLGGNDTYYVHNSADVVKEAPGGGTRDTVVASVNYTLPVGSAVEVLMTSNTGGTAGLHLTGNALAQTILGDAGANVINGAAGNDTLEGLGGNDTFYFNTALNATTNVDRIIDFTHGADKIELDHAIFTALAVANPLPSADFTTGTPTNPNQHIIYNTTTGALSYDDDGSGVHTAMQFATLANHAALTSADIFVV